MPDPFGIRSNLENLPHEQTHRSRGGSALIPLLLLLLLLLAWAGLGGPSWTGRGRRGASATPSLTGPVSLPAPEVPDNATPMRQLRWLRGRPVGLPERLVDAGYRFEQPALLPAPRSIVQARAARARAR